MIDRDRLLAKLDELDGYLRELRSVAPEHLEDYLKVEKKRGVRASAPGLRRSRH